jgi:hypothetical protein
MKTIEVSVLVNSGSVEQTLNYVLHDIVEFHVNSNGFFFIKTNENTWYFPINQTILNRKF